MPAVLRSLAFYVQAATKNGCLLLLSFVRPGALGARHLSVIVSYKYW